MYVELVSTAEGTDLCLSVQSEEVDPPVAGISALGDPTAWTYRPGHVHTLNGIHARIRLDVVHMTTL